MEKKTANIKYTCSWMKHMIPRIYKCPYFESFLSNYVCSVCKSTHILSTHFHYNSDQQVKLCNTKHDTTDAIPIQHKILGFGKY